MTLVVNLYAGPGTGKSTTAALAFGELKTLGVNCEYVQEYAKDRVWDEHFSVFSNQIYLLGKTVSPYASLNRQGRCYSN